MNSIPLLKADTLCKKQNLISMPRYDQAEKFIWRKNNTPDLIVFISHRWGMRTNPDPDGSALQTIRKLLCALDRVSKGLDPCSNSPMPDLSLPYILQASLLFDRILEKQSEWDNILNHVAVFYDYSCLPQGDEPKEVTLRRKGLSYFPSFIPDPSVTLVALRSQGDEYEKRIWCVAESTLAVTYEEGRHWRELFPIRVDKEQLPLNIEYEPLGALIKKWNATIHNSPQVTDDYFNYWLDIINYCRTWFGSNPDDASKQIHHTGVSADVSFMMFLTTSNKLMELGNTTTNLEPIIRNAAIEIGLKCTEDEDYFAAGLITLGGLRWEQLNRSGYDNLPDIWLQAFKKYCTRQQVMVKITCSPKNDKLPKLQLV